MGTPHFFAGTLVQSNQSATNAVLAAAVTGDDQVFSDGGWGSDHCTCGVVIYFGCPKFFACFRVQSRNLGVKATNENLAVVVSSATVIDVAACVLVNRFGHLGRVFPLDFTRFCIHSKNVFGAKGRCDEQSVTNQNGGRFLRAVGAELQCPLHAEFVHVSRGDLCTFAVTHIAGVATIGWPALCAGKRRCAQGGSQRD